MLQKEIEKFGDANFELSRFYEIFNTDGPIDLELSKIQELADEIVRRNANTRILILFTVVNRIKNISEKIDLFRKSLKIHNNDKVIPELMVLSEYIKNENILNDLFKYCDTELQNEPNTRQKELVYEFLNNVLKISSFSMNMVVEVFFNSTSVRDLCIIDEYMPFELQDRNFNNYLWISILDVLNKSRDGCEKYGDYLAYLLRRMLNRGYCKHLCSLIVEIANESTVYSLSNLEFDIKGVFLRISELISHGDKRQSEKFVIQLLKEIETVNIEVINERVTLKSLPTANKMLSLLSVIIDYCIVNKFGEVCIYTLFKERLSLNISLSLLDISILNITNKDEMDKLNFLKSEFDYMFLFERNEEGGEENENRLCDKIINVIDDEFSVYLEFYKKIFKVLLEKWELNDNSEENSYVLSVLIIRVTSIMLFIGSIAMKSETTVSELLLSQYKFVANGIQIRLKSINPIVRYSSMYLGEFYFNVLTTLFPQKSECGEERNGYLTTGQVPKFDELDSLSEDIKSKFLYHLKYSTNTIIISNENTSGGDTCAILEESTAKYNGDNTESKTVEKAENTLCDVRLSDGCGDCDIDSEDIFWKSAPDIKKSDSNKLDRACSFRIGDRKDKSVNSKIVIRSYDLITFYTDDKKSSQISNKEEILLGVLNDLLLGIGDDNSNYDYIILPLINKLISFNDKELRYASLLIISKIIELRTDYITIDIIDYACNMSNSISMDTRILLLNSLILACRTLSNYISNPGDDRATVLCSINRKKNKVIVNLFDQYSLIWLSNLTRYLVDIIKQSQGERYEQIPNIFFITILELLNNIILNTSLNNTHTEQISTLAFEVMMQIDTQKNPLFQDPTIRKSMYMLAFNIVQKYNCSFGRDQFVNSLTTEIANWILKNEVLEKDSSCIDIINEIKSCIVFTR